MFKRIALIIAAIAFAAIPAAAQSGVFADPFAVGTGLTLAPRPLLNGSHTTTNCSPGVSPVLYDSGGYYVCTSTNTWTLLATGSAASFGTLTGGTNATPATMLVGNGSSLGYTGTGSINASTLAGNAIGTSGAAVGLLNANLTFGGTDTFTNAPTITALGGSGTLCLHVSNTGLIGVAAADCGTGSAAFTSLSSGTNSTAAMVVTTGASLNYSASGTINASSLAGNTIGTSGAAIGLLNSNLTFGGTDTFSAVTTFTLAPTITALAGGGQLCVHVTNAGVLGVAAGDCGTSSGTISFQGTPTANACITDYDTSHIQTPSANCVVDSSGNMTAESYTSADTSHSGVIIVNGKTSGTQALACADACASANVTLVLPTTNATTGQVLSDSGTTTCPTTAGSPPATCHLLQWITVSGTGTVTSITAASGLTATASNPITASGTISLASISNNAALCNNSGGSAAPTTANCTVTGTGNLVLATSPAIATPTLTNPSLGAGSVPSALIQSFTNDGSTGTTNALIAKLSANNTVVKVGTSDTEAVGIVVSGGNTTGSSQVAVLGSAACMFDNTSTAGHYVQISTGTAGDCHDAGATLPTSGGTIIGKVIDGGAAGSHNVELTITPPGATGGTSTPCTTTALSLQYNNAGAFGCLAEYTYASSTITVSSAGVLDLATNVATFKYGPKAPWVSDTDGICGAVSSCPAGFVVVTGTNTDASFATNVAVAQNIPASGRSIRVSYGFDTSNPSSPSNIVLKLNACLTANLTTGASYTCSSGGVALWTSNAGQAGTASVTKSFNLVCDVVGGGSNTLYTSCNTNGMIGVASNTAVKSTFASMASGGWTLYWTVQYASSSIQYVRQASGQTEYVF